MPIITDINAVPTGDTLQTLLDEFRARGYNYLDDARATRLINFAYRELCGQYQWPFLEQVQTVRSGVRLLQSGLVLSVADVTTAQPIPWVARRVLVENGNDLTGVEG